MGKVTFFSKKPFINLKGKLVPTDKPVVMGILNITPDSFFANSRIESVQQLIDQAGKMLDEGAAILDLGGVSTRPGSVEVSEQQEIDRLAPAAEALHQHFAHIPLSIDTYRSGVARLMVKSYGAAIINDISAGQLDAEMFRTVGELGVPYVLMHMQGTPQTMQQQPVYDDMMKEVTLFFAEKLAELRQLGVADVIIDPGFGFGKTVTHNFELLAKMDELQVLDCPLLVGVSRKSMIYKTLNSTPLEALNGTTVLHTLVLTKGAFILRAHDVKPAVEAIKLVHEMQQTIIPVD